MIQIKKIFDDGESRVFNAKDNATIDQVCEYVECNITLNETLPLVQVIVDGVVYCEYEN